MNPADTRSQGKGDKIWFESPGPSASRSVSSLEERRPFKRRISHRRDVDMALKQDVSRKSAGFNRDLLRNRPHTH
jgi:hypothetical protein